MTKSRHAFILNNQADFDNLVQTKVNLNKFNLLALRPIKSNGINILCSTKFYSNNEHAKTAALQKKFITDFDKVIKTSDLDSNILESLKYNLFSAIGYAG